MIRFPMASTCFATVLSVPGILSAMAILAALLVTVARGDNDPDYFPLEAGRSWAYEIVMESFRGHEVQKSFVTNLGSRDLDDQALAARLLHNGQIHYYEHKADGLARVATRKPEAAIYWEVTPAYLFHSPLVASTSWHQNERTFLLIFRLFNADENAEIPMLMYYRIERMDEVVKVPAGIFRDCMKVTGKGETSVKGAFSEAFIELTVQTVDYFAPGVGLVKSERLETSSHPRYEGGEYVRELQGYSTSWLTPWL